MKDYIYCALAMLIFASVFVFAIIYGTSDKVWYAGKHDADCEKIENCGCYERFTGVRK